MIGLIDRIPLVHVALFTVFLGLAPLFPEPHLVEKIKMLMSGNLSRPIDIFDVFWHSWPMVLLLIKLHWMNLTKGR